jgi:putative endonuclease
MFFTYITTNKRNGTLYTGHTDDLAQRMHQHKVGHFPGFARKYGCKHLVWYEEHETRQDAFTRERRIKEWNRAWKLRLIEKDNPHWIDIMASPVWPLPKGEIFADLRHAAMAHKLDPALRRGERVGWI